MCLFSFHSYLAGYRILSLILSSVFADYSVLRHHFRNSITWSFFFFFNSLSSTITPCVGEQTPSSCKKPQRMKKNEVLENMKVGKVLMALQFISL